MDGRLTVVKEAMERPRYDRALALDLDWYSFLLGGNIYRQRLHYISTWPLHEPVFQPNDRCHRYLGLLLEV